jgi:hypothetical protein
LKKTTSDASFVEITPAKGLQRLWGGSRSKRVEAKKQLEQSLVKLHHHSNSKSTLNRRFKELADYVSPQHTDQDLDPTAKFGKSFYDNTVSQSNYAREQVVNKYRRIVDLNKGSNLKCVLFRRDKKATIPTPITEMLNISSHKSIGLRPRANMSSHNPKRIEYTLNIPIALKMLVNR